MEICTKYGPANTEFSKTHKCKCWLHCQDKYEEIIKAQDELEAKEKLALENQKKKH